MKSESFYNPNHLRNRWVAYFDLLGTKALINSGRYIEVFRSYKNALKRSKSQLKSYENLSRICLSETFIIFSKDDSLSSFASIHSISRWFMFFLLKAEIPLRGAIAYGEFYADESEQIFFGKALVEAYEYAEQQNWIGLILVPSTIQRLDSIGLPANKMYDYAEWDVVFKNRLPAIEKCYACIVGNWNKINSKNSCLENLKRMMTKTTDLNVQNKYKRTIEFVEKNYRTTSKRPMKE
jgi:hypothetical protein